MKSKITSVGDVQIFQDVKPARKRNVLLDYFKGIAIFLVVWGHCLQYAANASYDFFSNEVFIVIYSFHMPLFMFISGYLFFLTQKTRAFGLPQTVKQNKFLFHF
jgi:fucose 4-O-acetylase-like acetyltransferase